MDTPMYVAWCGLRMWFADVVKSWLFMESGSCGAKECGDFRGVEGVRKQREQGLKKNKQLEMVVVYPLWYRLTIAQAP